MGTTTIDISSGEPAQNHPVRPQPAVRLRWPLLLLLTCVLALVPYVLPQHLIESFPRFGVVLYYAVLSLLTGWFGITWIWQTARFVLSADSKERDMRS